MKRRQEGGGGGGGSEQQAVSMSDWLSSFKMSKYEEAFINHGFDRVEFLGQEVIGVKEDLDEIGITNEADQKVILEEVRRMAPIPNLGKKNNRKEYWNPSKIAV